MQLESHAFLCGLLKSIPDTIIIWLHHSITMCGKMNHDSFIVCLKMLPAGMLFPPGIKNQSNICFASSSLHCLLNQQVFTRVIDSAKVHHSSRCSECQQGQFLLHALLKIARDKVFEQLTKLEKGKYSHRITEINKRHKSAIKMSVTITRQNETGWMVPSDHDGSVTYNVRLLRDTCNCKLRCKNCDACIHMYACTCMDSMLHATVCKHVHLVKIRTTAKVSATVPHTSTTAEYFSSVLDEKSNDQLFALCQQVFSKLNDITVLVTGCHNADALKTSSKHLTAAIMAMRAMQSTSAQSILPIKRKIPANRNSEKQQRFFSTKKKTSWCFKINQAISKRSARESIAPAQPNHNLLWNMSARR